MHTWKVRSLAIPRSSLHVGTNEIVVTNLEKDGPLAGPPWFMVAWCAVADTVLYQHVPCEKGRTYQLETESRFWNPWDNREMIICAMVGIDPAGGDDPLAESVIWSSPTYRQKEWTRLSAATVAEHDQITVYLRGYSRYSRLMNTRFRSAKLTDITYGK